MAGWRWLAAGRRIVSAVLAGLMLLSGPGAALAEGAAGGLPGGFSDIPKGFWAEQLIDRMSAKGLIVGSGGRFEPARAMTRYEALAVIVRVLGLEESARARASIPAAFREAAAVPAWARGYVAEAVERGIIAGGELTAFHGGERATRLQVAAWLVRALGLEEEARQASSAAGFTDLGGVAAGWRGYVAVIADLGIMAGSQGRFRPYDPVPRAEMAAIVARLDRFLANDFDKNEFEGTVESSGDTLVLKLADGSRRTFALGGPVAAYFDGIKASVNMVMPGDHATVITDASGRALYMEVSSQALRIEGVIASVDAGARTVTVKPDQGEARSYAVPAGAAVLVNGRPAGVSRLRAGQRVTVEGQGATVTRVTARSQVTKRRGEVTSLVVLPRGGVALGVRFPGAAGAEDRVFTLPVDVAFTLNGEPSRLIYLQVRDRVTIHLSDDQVVRVAGESYERTVKGTIRAIAFGETSRLTVELAAGSAWAAEAWGAAEEAGPVQVAGPAQAVFAVAQGAEVIKDDRNAALTSLRAGDEVEVRLTGDEVTRVTARTRYTTVAGVVYKLTIGDPLEIAVRTGEGQTVTYKVAADVSVKVGANYVSFVSLKPGHRVQLTVAYDVVTAIKVSGQGVLDDIKGVVQYVDLREGKFVIETEGGATRHVKPAAAFLLIRFGVVRDRISYLSEGDTVIVVGKDVPGEPFTAEVVVVIGKAED